MRLAKWLPPWPEFASFISSTPQMNPRRLKLLIAYDGSAYHGWQSGRSGSGVADHVTKVLADLLELDGDLVSSSRTDSGVHAMGLVAHADVRNASSTLCPLRLRERLNARLPGDIRIREVTWAGSGFHARFGARAKEYRYRIWNEATMNPLLDGQAWHVARALDGKAMKLAAARLVGEHDFRAFTSKRDGVLGGTVRHLQHLSIRRSGSEWTITLKADGFLYKMCRALVGTLVHVGCGKMDPDQVTDLLQPGASRTPGPNAPAQGLVLWRVSYGKS